MVRFLLYQVVTVLLLLGCQPAVQQRELVQAPQCIEGQSHCTIDTPYGTIEIAFNVKYLVAEQPFEMHISSMAPNWQLSSAYMEGVDMFMGKIPLFFEQNESANWVAEAMFGSCSEQQMTWRVWLTFTSEQINGNSETAESNKTVTFTIKSYQGYSSIPQVV